MSQEVYAEALQLCEDHCSSPFLGGGEPTVHPNFKLYLIEAIAKACEIGEGVAGIITNGKITKLGKLIASLTKGGVLSGSLSQDQYHDPISPDVVAAFMELEGWDKIWDTTKDGSRDPLPHGRAIEYMGWEEEDVDALNEDGAQCICSDYFIKPNGDVHQCGCADSPKIGDVFNGIDTPAAPGECYRSQWFVEACMESKGHEHLVYA